MDLDYNTSRKKLVLPEYGRNIQKMVNHLKTVEDRDERNRLAKAVIQIMGSMNPHLRDVSDFTHKLWDHLAIISDFELDVDSPYPLPSKEDIYKKPEKLSYKRPDDIKFKHYGKVLEDMIQKAVEYPDGEEKDALIGVIATQMKKSYITWNRENITDEQIFQDLLFLAKNKLKIPEGLKLKDVRELMPRKTAISSSKKGATSQKGRSKSNPRQKSFKKKR